MTPLIEFAPHGRFGGPERSARPQPDREPERRNVPRVEPEPVKVQAPNVSAFAPEAVDLWRRIESIPEERAGAFMGLLMRAPGDLRGGAGPWWWCYGRQPVFVKGAAWRWSTVRTDMLRAISEDAAARAYFAVCVREMEIRGEDATATRAQLAALTGMSRRQIKRRQGGRR